MNKILVWEFLVYFITGYLHFCVIVCSVFVEFIVCTACVVFIAGVVCIVCFISLLVSCTLKKEKQHKSFVQLLVHCLIDLTHFLIMNGSRRSLSSSWSLSLVMSHTFKMEYEQKSSGELRIYFLTDFIHFQSGV